MVAYFLVRRTFTLYEIAHWIEPFEDASAEPSNATYGVLAGYERLAKESALSVLSSQWEILLGPVFGERPRAQMAEQAVSLEVPESRFDALKTCLRLPGSRCYRSLW